MESRREFLKKAALLSGTAGIAGFLPPSIQKAFAIDPETGTTYLDAEHVVILMQENRSFDHCYGSLQGVRGFNDPRAIELPNKNKVWLQTNKKGETFAPFRLNIKDTNATWMGSLPHGWTDQTDARNEGKYDQWLEAKKAGNKDFQHMPLTMGYYNREDLPFYYGLADAFTICDQNFCSSLTGTTPNRLYLWTGKIREDANAQARVRNEETDYRREAQWKTFPERLEENNIPWKIYQNEISVGVGFKGEEDSWLANFTDNPIEWFSQYNVRFLPEHMRYLPQRIEELKSEIAEIETKLKETSSGSDEFNQLNRRLAGTKQELNFCIEDVKKYTTENFNKLSQKEKNLHQKAFANNRKDSNYHTLDTLKYNDGTTEREMKVPKGDVLFQFREDVNNGKLPTISWLVAPETFSDHPGAPWYGAWYLSEAMDILTKNPEVWKKTIFILCYDENDGYFDHVSPFVPPVHGKPETGQASKNIDLQTEYVSLERDLERKPKEYARGGSIGLGYRVPLVVASPWSRGGTVCSQVFDHTSILQFLEKFLSNKTGKKIEETNISTWRRTVCGDLTSVFKPYNGEKMDLPSFLKRDEFVEGIHKAQFKNLPSGFVALTPEQIKEANANPLSKHLTRQEKGTRPSRSLPYELHVNGKLSDDKKNFELKLKAGKTIKTAAGSPFQVYGPGKDFSLRNYAVAAGDILTDTWSENQFDNGKYNLKVYGPNGFFRQFKGDRNEPLIQVSLSYDSNPKMLFTGNVILSVTNKSNQSLTIHVKDNAYQSPTIDKTVAANSTVEVIVDLKNSHQWYDSSVLIDGHDHFENRFAGRVETGSEGISDPAMA